MRELVKQIGFYWEGFSSDIKSLINNCPICTSTKNLTKIKTPIKQIIDEGPHFRYEADLWHLDEVLKLNNEYNYCLDIIDHFSKFLRCYLLTDKTMTLVCWKIKYHIFNYGKCKLFQCDNGREFKNRELKIFLENEGIDLIFSRVRHPQTKGCVEATHKIVRKNLLRDYNIKKDNFNIDISLTEFIIYYNNTLNNVTKRIPIEIKDIDDPEEISEINRNIIKSMLRKIKTVSNVDKDDALLLTTNIKIESTVIKLKYKKKK